MNLLSLSRSEVVAFVQSGMLRPENLRHYDICKALAEGKTQEWVADQFNLTDDRYVRRLKAKKCPDCNRVK